MFIHESKVRVRYAETDQMGYVYYGNYATFFEIARVDSMKSLGVSYKEIENAGVIMPVLHYATKYYKPALYDDELTIKTIIKKLPTARIHFDFEVFKEVFRNRFASPVYRIGVPVAIHCSERGWGVSYMLYNAHPHLSRNNALTN